MRIVMTAWLAVCLLAASTGAQRPLRLTIAEYEDRVLADRTGQIIATLMGFQFAAGRLRHKHQSVHSHDRWRSVYGRSALGNDRS